jgi:streptogramin lyase
MISSKRVWAHVRRYVAGLVVVLSAFVLTSCPSPIGTVTNFTGTGISSPYGIAAGPRGNLWFTNISNSSIGRITPAGVVSSFTNPSISNPLGITAGPDGGMWFTHYNSIGRITAANLP